LGPVLEAVLGQEGAPAAEVVALDSGSRDGTLALLAEHPVRVEHLARFTYGAALNRGAALARGALVVYLSAHCRPLARDWLARLLAPFTDPQVVASFGRQVPVPGVNPIEALTTARNFPPAPPPGVLFSTANGAVRRAAVLAQPFDEEIAIAEDHLWARGAAERIAYVPEAAVAHSHPMGLGPWRARFYAHGLAAEYARRRRGVELPWGEPRDGAPGHLGGIQPTPHFGDPGGAYRRAIVAPPRSRLRFAVHVPPGGALHFSTAVEGRERGAGVRFAVAVDGRQVFARTLDPASRRRDRRWFDERVDLGPWADKDVEIVLATEAAGTGPLGAPGWSHVRLVRESRRARQAASATTPSILVVLVDTLRADHLGCYGAAPSPSPVVDRLAAGGLVFEQAVAQSSWTMPSVATLFTGLHPRSHGVVGASADGALAARDPGCLADTLPTLAEHAEAAGISTVGVSASPLVSRATNLARGFETFVEFSW